MSIKNKMILIGGMPASGKTTLGKKLCKMLKLPFLDKDILCDKYTNFVVAKETFANDRSSPLYKETLRDLEYEIMFDVGLSQVELGICPVLVSPFSSEFVDMKKINKIKKKLKLVNPDYELVTILIEACPAVVHKQMKDRGRKEDKTKLNNWSNYIQRKMDFQEKARKNVNHTTTVDKIKELIKVLKK